MLGIKADPIEVDANISDPSMKNGASQPLQHEVDVLGDFILALDRIEQQQEFVAADPRQHVGFAQVQPEPLGDFHQQRVADVVAVIVVDVLEIVDVEKGERELGLRLAAQQAVGAMLDHPPRRQAGQFVIIGRAEQLVLERLLFADIGRTRQQQVAFRDPDRPMGGEEYLPDLTAGEAFFRRYGAAGTQTCDAGFAALIQLRRSHRSMLRAGNAQLHRGGVVHQQETAVLVLHRHAAGEHSEDVAQYAELEIRREFVIRRRVLRIV